MQNVEEWTREMEKWEWEKDRHRHRTRHIDTDAYRDIFWSRVL
jgi:hypothetical protein